MNCDARRAVLRRLSLTSLLWVALPIDLPAQESSEPSSGGIFEIGIWWVAPRNNDLDYAFIDETSSLSGGGQVQTLSYDRDNDLTIRAGWQFGSPGSPALTATLWETDTRASAQTGDRPGQIGALLASPDFAIGRSFVDSATASSRLRATLVDLDFTWNRESESRMELAFSGGIRLFRYEENTVVAYGVDSSGQQLEEFVNTTSDADGMGPKGAISFGYRVHPRLTFRVGLDIAVPMGEIESVTTDTVLVNDSFLQAAAADRPGTDKAFLQLGGDFRLTGKLGPGWTASLSYRFLNWSDVRATVRLVDDLSQNTALVAESDVLFEGLQLAVGYSF